MLCPVARDCGGCPSLLLGRDEERLAKMRALRQALEPVGERAMLPEIAWRAAHGRTGYRIRIRLAVGTQGNVGFFNRKKSPDCVALTADLGELRRRVVALAARRPGLFAGSSHLELRGPDDEGRAGLEMVFRTAVPSERAEREDALRFELPDCEVLLSGKGAPKREAPCQTFRIFRDVAIEVPLGAFVQVNAFVNRLLVGHVVASAESVGAGSFVDLFAGAGNFALPLGAAGLSGLAVERNPASVRATRRGARRLGLEVEAAEGDVAREVGRLVDAGRRFDLAVVDGPRAGLRSGHEDVAKLADAIIVCSCNPKTFARDLERFLGHGFRLVDMTAFDMFPGTEHLEVVATLRRDRRLAKGVAPVG